MLMFYGGALLPRLVSILQSCHTILLYTQNQDRHLDRLGSILRSLRAPPDEDVPFSSKRKAQGPQHRDGLGLGLRSSGPSSLTRSRTASQSSQTEILFRQPRKPRANQSPAARACRAPSKRDTPRVERVRVEATALPERLSAAPRVEFVPPAPVTSRTAEEEVRSGQQDAENKNKCNNGNDSIGVLETSSTAASRTSSLKSRAVSTWWRSLSCGVCFAAGAWVRDGHGVFGVVLALGAVCAEVVLHEYNPFSRN